MIFSLLMTIFFPLVSHNCVFAPNHCASVSMSTTLSDNVVSALLPLHRLTTLLSAGVQRGKKIKKCGSSLMLSRGFQHGLLPGEALKGWGRVVPLTLTAGHPKSIRAR